MRLISRQQRDDRSWQEACQAYLDCVYGKIKQNHNHSLQDTLSDMHQQVALTYGEILFMGFQRLQRAVPFTAEDVFVDCGSGLGRLLVQALLMTEARQIIGVEIEPHLAELSQQAVDCVRGECPFLFDDREVTIINKDFLAQIIEPATVLFCCATCFNEDLVAAIGHWMNQLPNLRAVLALKPLPTLSTCRFRRVVSVECTWDTALCYIYAR